MSSEFRVIDDAGSVPLRGNWHSGRFKGITPVLMALRVGSAISVPLKDGEGVARLGASVNNTVRRVAKRLGIPRHCFIARTLTLENGSREYRIYRVEADGVEATR